MFKVGDRVRCVDNTNMGAVGQQELTLGGEYVVNEISTAYPDQMRLKGNPLLWRMSRFELVERVQEEQTISSSPMLYLCKVGDEVTLEVKGVLSREQVESIMNTVYGNNRKDIDFHELLRK